MPWASHARFKNRLAPDRRLHQSLSTTLAISLTQSSRSRSWSKRVRQLFLDGHFPQAVEEGFSVPQQPRKGTCGTHSRRRRFDDDCIQSDVALLETHAVADSLSARRAAGLHADHGRGHDGHPKSASARASEPGRSAYRSRTARALQPPRSNRHTGNETETSSVTESYFKYLPSSCPWDQVEDDRTPPQGRERHRRAAVGLEREVWRYVSVLDQGSSRRRWRDQSRPG